MKKFLAILMTACMILSIASIAAAEPVQLDLWHYFSTTNEYSDGTIFEKNIDTYNESQDKIHINCTYVGREDLLKQYTMGALSGDLPDIGMVDNPDMASFIQMGVFADITEQLNAWGELDQFYVGPLNSCTMDGKIYGIPHNSNDLALFYDVDMLAEAGIEVPTTWSELEVACEKLTNHDIGRYGLAISAVKNEEGCFQYMPWFISAGGDITELNSPACVKSLEYLGSLIDNGYMTKDVINYTQADANNQFVSGNAAMQVNGPWNVGAVRELAPDKNWAVAYVPRADDGVYASVLGGENFGPTTACENLDEAVEFLTWMMGAENSAEYAETTGKFSPRADSNGLNKTLTEDPIFKVFAENLQYAMPRGPHPRWPEISTAISTAEHEVFTGVSDAQTALDKAAATVSAILAE